MNLSHVINMLASYEQDVQLYRHLTEWRTRCFTTDEIISSEYMAMLKKVRQRITRFQSDSGIIEVTIGKNYTKHVDMFGRVLEVVSH